MKNPFNTGLGVLWRPNVKNCSGPNGYMLKLSHFKLKKSPRGLVSWTRAVDPYTFYVPQITIAAKREPFKIDQFGRVETLLRMPPPCKSEFSATTVNAYHWRFTPVKYVQG